MLGQLPGLSKGLWMDEYATISFAEDPQFLNRASKYNTPPTYFGIVRGLRMLGMGEEGLRGLSLVLALGAFCLIFLTLSREWGAPCATVVSLWLLSRPLILFHSTEIRPYPLLWFFLALGIWAARRPQSPAHSQWPWFVAVLGLTFTHAIGLLCIPVLLALRHDKAPRCPSLRKTGFLALGMAGILIVGLYGNHLDKQWWADRQLRAGWVRHVSASMGYENSWWHWPALVPLLGLAVGRFRLWMTPALYLALVVGVSYGLTAILIQRALSPVLFFLALPLADSLHRLNQRRVWGFALLGIATLDTFGLYQGPNQFPRMPLKAAESYLKETHAGGDFLVLQPYAFNQHVGTFYGPFNQDDLVRLPKTYSELPDAWEQILRRVESGGRFRVLLTEPWLLEGSGRKVVQKLRVQFASRLIRWGKMELIEFYPTYPANFIKPLIIRPPTLKQQLLTQSINAAVP